MADAAAHLVDHVLPKVPYRQWTLALPYPVRHVVGFSKELLAKVLRTYLRTLFAWQRLQARRAGIPKSQTGAVTLCQRYGSLLQFSPHFHSWLPDGVFYLDDAGQLAFHRLEPPTDEDIQALVIRIHQRIDTCIDKTDACDIDDEHAELCESSPSQVLPGSASVLRPEKTRCATFEGTSLHADLATHANERKTLQRLLRYGLRHPFSLKRLKQRPDSTVLLELRKPLASGKTHIPFEPLDFLRRLAAIISPPRLNLVRFHGVFAPRAKLRPSLAALMPAPHADSGTTCSDTPPADPHAPSGPHLPQNETDIATESQSHVPPRYRRPWAELLKRVFDIESILLCPLCGNTMHNIAHIEQPKTIARILAHLGLPTAPPPVADARAPPQLELTFDELDDDPHSLYGSWD
jgi:hypothetical protein